MIVLKFDLGHMSLPVSPSIFTVSRLNQTVRQLLEMEMGQIWLSAEISNLSQPASGHWYFTLKDDRAQVRCAMFRNSNRRVTFRPQNGQQVLVRASITLYEPRGDYQLIAESMQPAGDGLLQQQFEQLKQRLSAEGLFDQQFKQPLPAPAKRVGVITSASGAALHDILQVLQRRDPSLPIVIYPTSVQGAEAPMQIVRAIETANRRDECDVLIVGRGGGSLEDLWSFNDERVARAIFASRIPIVSAVGHETDVTIADFVADLRAPTPSAAAELVSRNQLELLRQLQSQQQRLEMAMDYYLAQRQQQFTRIHHRLQQQHPHLRLARQQTLLFKLQRRMEDGMQQQLRLPQRTHPAAAGAGAAAGPHSPLPTARAAAGIPSAAGDGAPAQRLPPAFRRGVQPAGDRQPAGDAGARLQRDANSARRAAENHQAGAGRRTAENPPAGWLGGKRGENHHRRQKAAQEARGRVSPTPA